MHVHIWPSRTRSVTAPNADISDHASCVASSVGTGTVWKWSYTHTLCHGPLSAALARSRITRHWSLVSMPARSSRQPCGMNIPKRMESTLGGPVAGVSRDPQGCWVRERGQRGVNVAPVENRSIFSWILCPQGFILVGAPSYNRTREQYWWVGSGPVVRCAAARGAAGAGTDQARGGACGVVGGRQA